MRRKLSLGELAAAWVCCGGLALGAILINSGERDGSAAAAYAGAHIPGRGAVTLPEHDLGRDQDDEQAAELNVFAKPAGTMAISSAEDLPAPVSADARKGVARHCRYTLRQSLLRYSAAARLADAGAASGVRDASQ
jgi:hypothetical protein